MAWTVPKVTRNAKVWLGDERTVLEAWLDYHRETLLLKCEGLTSDQLKMRSVPPSGLSLLGIVRHMTEVERSWFRLRFANEPIDHIYGDWGPDDDRWAGYYDVMLNGFNNLSTADAQTDIDTYLAEIECSRAATKGHSLEETFVNQRPVAETSLRALYVHLIEEYARHNGHADLIRERIDGAIEPGPVRR